MASIVRNKLWQFLIFPAKNDWEESNTQIKGILEYLLASFFFSETVITVQDDFME